MFRDPTPGLEADDGWVDGGSNVLSTGALTSTWMGSNGDNGASMRFPIRRWADFLTLKLVRVSWRRLQGTEQPVVGPPRCHQISCMKQESHLLNWALWRWEIDCFFSEISNWVRIREGAAGPIVRLYEGSVYCNQEVTGSSPASSNCASIGNNHTGLPEFSPRTPAT